MSDLREEFERWVTSPPYERSVARLGESSSWPGHYVDYEVQLAFEAWTAALELLQSCVAIGTHGGKCHVFRTAEVFREWVCSTDHEAGVLAWVDGLEIGDR